MCIFFGTMCIFGGPHTFGRYDIFGVNFDIFEEELGWKEGRQILKQRHEANLGDILSLFLTDHLKLCKFSNQHLWLGSMQI